MSEVDAGDRRAFAEFLATTTIDSIPGNALEQAKLLVASTFASAAVGRSTQSVEVLRAIARDEGGKPEARVWFSDGLLLPAVAAAGLNATASDAAASDDSDLRTGAHTGTAIVASAFAAAGKVPGTTGRDVLAAIAVGYEAGGRIGAALGDGMRRRGFHPSVIAAFAAAEAAAKVLGWPRRPRTRSISAPRKAEESTPAPTRSAGSTPPEPHGTEVPSSRAAAPATAAAAASSSGPEAFSTFSPTHRTLPGSPLGLARAGISWTHLLIKLQTGAYLFTSAVDAACELALDPAFQADAIEEVVAEARPSPRRRGRRSHPISRRRFTASRTTSRRSSCTGTSAGTASTTTRSPIRECGR